MIINEKIWVLAPFVESVDENIQYYYDYKQSIAEYTKVFETLKQPWFWQNVRLDSFQSTINQIIEDAERENCTPIFLNLCDGDEVNGAPGISVVKYLEESNQIFTGASRYFFEITTSKIPMKIAFDAAGVATAKWQALRSINDINEQMFKKMSKPIILKPAVSGGSMGVGVKSVVYEVQQAKDQFAKIKEGYRGWNLTVDGVIAERFIKGPEFTVFIIGDYQQAESATIFTPIERVFHKSLPADQQFLSFDRLWEIYEEEPAMPNEEFFYQYAAAPSDLIKELKQRSWDAFVACRGTGYTRVDLRMDEDSQEIFVLEVNAQCGISEDEDYTSIGAILKFSNRTFAEAVSLIIKAAKEKFAKIN